MNIALGDCRDIATNRCLIIADVFYEFTDPKDSKKRKDKWRFTLRDEAIFCVAGIGKSSSWNVTPGQTG